MKIINTVLQWLKPLPIIIFRNEAHVKDILNICIKKFDPRAKIGEIFLVDIEFTTCDDARKVYPCIFESKNK